MHRPQLIAASFLTLALMTATTPASAVAPPPWCRPTGDMLAQRFLVQMLDLATSDDSGWTTARDARCNYDPEHRRRPHVVTL